MIWREKYATCERGCRHYHGVVTSGPDGGELLVEFEPSGDAPGWATRYINRHGYAEKVIARGLATQREAKDAAAQFLSNGDAK